MPYHRIFSPADCFQAPVATVQETTGIIPGLRSRIKSVSPSGFEIDWIPASKTSQLNKYRNVVVDVRWPDTSGRNVLFRLSVPSIEKLIMKLTLVMSAMQSCDHLVTQSGPKMCYRRMLHTNFYQDTSQRRMLFGLFEL
jgi:hypothetical protein